MALFLRYSYMFLFLLFMILELFLSSPKRLHTFQCTILHLHQALVIVVIGRVTLITTIDVEEVSHDKLVFPGSPLQQRFLFLRQRLNPRPHFLPRGQKPLFLHTFFLFFFLHGSYLICPLQSYIWISPGRLPIIATTEVSI